MIPAEMAVQLRAGDVVKVRQGKYTGNLFVVVATEGESRAFITDGKKYSTNKPKKKNVMHLQRTQINLEDVAGRVAGGKPLDNGWLIQRISTVSSNGSTSCIQGG